MRKGARAPRTAQDHGRTDAYARFAMVFGSDDDTPTQPHKNKRLSVLDECEEDVESGRKDAMYGEDWDIAFFQSVNGNQALEHDVEQLCPKDSMTKRNSWKKRLSDSNLRINTCLASSSSKPETFDRPSLDKTIIKTVSHTAIFTNKTPIVYQRSPEEYMGASLDKTIATTPLSASLELERERIQRLFEDDLHQKRMELRREKYASPRHSNVLHCPDAGGLRRRAGDFESRIRTLNDRITILLMKHSHYERLEM